MSPPKYVPLLIPEAVCDLSGNRVFAGITTLRWYHTGLGCNLIQEEGHVVTETHRGRSCDDEAKVREIHLQAKDPRIAGDTRS